jgi:hypothetical protein
MLSETRKQKHSSIHRTGVEKIPEEQKNTLISQ